MDRPTEAPGTEIQNLQRCINDLASVLALTAMWTGAGPLQIINTLLDALLGMLNLDVLYARLNEPASIDSTEMVRMASSMNPELPQAIGAVIRGWIDEDPEQQVPVLRKQLGAIDLSIVRLPIGLQGDIGVIVAGSRRPNFPEKTERLVLSVAANEAFIGLQEARLLGEEKRVAKELDHRVEERTRELAVSNEELRKEIAERKKIEKRLRRSEAFLAEGQHLARMGNFSWRVVTDEIVWSEPLYRIFEFEPKPTITMEQIASRVHPDDIFMLQDMIERARAGVSDLEYEHRLLMPNGSVKCLHLVAHGNRDAEGQLEYIGAVQDVTRRRVVEEALAKARAELSHITRVTSLGVLTASIAHEINQPLSGIVTNASTCLRMLAATPPNLEGARETARRTIRDGDRASDVVSRLRALFTNKDAADEPVNLNDVAREVLALLSSELQGNRVSLQLELADDIPVVHGDRVQLQQVILNLVRNASDSMSLIEGRARHLLIRTKCDIADGVCFEVQDTGVGFDSQAAARLFEAFYTTKPDGMGIGLSVSRSIIERHRGRLWATPNDSWGATFAFSIPVWSV